MKLLATDGKVKIGTEIDKSGAEKGLSEIGSFAKKGFSTLGSVAATAGKVAVGAIGAAATGVVTLGTASIAAGKDFETTMAAASTLFGDVDVNTEKLNADILKISSSTGIAASELNQGLYSALSAGIPVTEDMGEATAFLESSAKLAKAGFTDMDTALSATAKTLNAYSLDTSEADRINKILIQTQNKGITTVGELGASLAQVTPTAAAFGVSFENVGAALANMTAAGTPTAQATTQLNSLIAELGKSGTTGAKALEKAAKGTEYVGMSFKDMADAGVPLNTILDLIKKSADDSGLSMVDMFSSIEAGKAALAMSGENSAKFAENLAAMGTSADVVGEAYEKVSNTLETKTGKMAESAKNLGIRIYQGMQEPLMGLADMGLGYLQELTDAFETGGISGLVDTGAKIVVDIASGIADQLPSLINTGASIISGLLSAIQANIGGLASAGADIVMSLFEGAVSFLPQLADIGLQIVQMLYDGIISGIPVLFNAGADLLNNLSSGLDTKIPDMISKALDMIQNFATTLAQNAPVLIQAGITLLTNLITGIVNSIPTLIEKIPTIISTFANIINDNAPTVLQAGINMLVTLAKGIIAAIPTLIANIPKIITAIVDVWEAFNWINLGKNAIKFLKDGIMGMVTAAKNAGESVVKGVTGVIQQLPGKLLAFGKNAITDLSGAIKGGLSSAVGAAKEILAGITKTFKPSALLEVGKDLIKGLWNGISDMSGWIINKLKGFGESILGGIKDFFGIHSPSRRMAKEVGLPIVQGTAQGIENNTDIVAEAADKMGQTVIDSGQATAEKLEEQKDESLKSENDYWMSIAEITRRGAVAQENALDSLIDPKKDLLTNVTALFNNYVTELGKATDALMQSTGLFDEVNTKTEATGKSITKNLQDQVNMYAEYWSVMQQLRTRITNEGLQAAIAEMGVDSLGELKALNSMTDEELAQYAALYDQKYALCNMIAADSLTKLKSDTETKLAGMLGVTSVNLDQFALTFNGTLDSIKAYVSQTVTDVGNLQDDMSESGEQIMNGLISGMESKRDALEKTVEGMIKLAAEAAASAAQIHSPSRLFRDKIGKNLIAGINVGMEMKADSLEQTAKDIIKGSANALSREVASGYVAKMRSQIEYPTTGNDSENPWKYPKNPDSGVGNSIPQKIVLEKGSITGNVVLDGEKVGEMVAPAVDMELGSAAGRKERGL